MRARRGRRGPPRRWCVPPAIMRGPSETVDGIGILDELSGDLGVLLWKTVRDVTLWGDTPPEQRGNLFADGSGDARIIGLLATDVPTAISASVDTIHGMLPLGERADAGDLSLCCLEVAAWAHKAGLSETAITFAQAGAVAAPEFGEAALQTGMYALRAGQVARAGTWLLRAVAVSRRERNRPAYAAALVELGVLYEAAGKADGAERFFRLGYRAAKRCPARNARMRAAHGLFRVARARGDTASAGQFALAAQAAYEPDAWGGPPLLLDLARFWTDLGEDVRALSTLRRLRPVRGRLSPAGQLASAALAARAFAVPGTPQSLATDAAGLAWSMMEDTAISHDVRLAAALDLAHAARTACDLVAFTRAKRAALTLAPRETYPAIVAEVTHLWPMGGLGRAS